MKFLKSFLFCVFALASTLLVIAVSLDIRWAALVNGVLWLSLLQQVIANQAQIRFNDEVIKWKDTLWPGGTSVFLGCREMGVQLLPRPPSLSQGAHRRLPASFLPLTRSKRQNPITTW